MAYKHSLDAVATVFGGLLVEARLQRPYLTFGRPKKACQMHEDFGVKAKYIALAQNQLAMENHAILHTIAVNHNLREVVLSQYAYTK